MALTCTWSGSRSPHGSTPAMSGVIPLRLNTSAVIDVNQAVTLASDVTLVVNDALMSRPNNLLSFDALEAVRAEFEANVAEPLSIASLFAPVLERNGGGTIVNVLSNRYEGERGMLSTYALSRAAAWCMTRALRSQLRMRGTRVVSVHANYVDSENSKVTSKTAAQRTEVARQVLLALRSDAVDVFADGPQPIYEVEPSAAMFMG